MTKLNSPKKTQPRPPTLRLDHHQAWRQSENAVIIPIVYDIAYDAIKQDSLTIPLPSPLPSASLTAQAPSLSDSAALSNEMASQETAPDVPPPLSKEFSEFPMDAAFAPLSPAPDLLFLVPPRSSFGHVHHLSTAVPLLLLSGIALVVFAWVAFR